jgi:hypothetical protein
MSWPMPTAPRAQPVQAYYHNKGTEPIKLSIGLGGPGVAWTNFDANPGEVVQGPLGYADKFAANGFTKISESEALSIVAEAVAKAQAEQAAEVAKAAEVERLAAEAAKAKAEAEELAKAAEVERLAAEAAKAKAEAEELAKAAEVERPDETVADPVVEPIVESVVEPVQEQKAPERKGRRADRSSTS